MPLYIKATVAYAFHQMRSADHTKKKEGQLYKMTSECTHCIVIYIVYFDRSDTEVELGNGSFFKMILFV